MNDDLISRQAVLDIVDSYSESQSNVEDVTLDIISDIVVLPSVNPQEPKTGHWKSFTHSAYHGIDDDGEPIWREVKVYHCNLCNRRTVIKENYCPNCGARMVEPQESEDEV